MASSWTCSVCTFINPSSSSSSQKPSCQICLSSKPSSISLPALSTSPAPTKPKWSCKACTFLNPYDNTKCDVCGTRASASLLSTVEVDDDEVDGMSSVVGNVFFPLRGCSSGKNTKRNVLENPAVEVEGFDDSGGGFRGLKAANKRKVLESPAMDAEGFDDSGGGFKGLKAANKNAKLKGKFSGKVSSPMECTAEENDTGTNNKPLKIMSYNVWFNEELEMRMRMKALGDLIQLHCPDIICFQEVTPFIYDVFQQSGWWKLYRCSVSNEGAFTRGYFCMQLSRLPVKSYSCKPFANSIMGRELCIAEVDVQADTSLLVATSHLESPCPAPPKWDQMYSKERVEQAKYAIKLLEENPNVIFCGDMNWDEKKDGQFPLPDGWVDAWVQLRPSENGWTYDTKSNKMLSGNRSLQKRLDRFVCNLRDFKINKIEMIGMDEIPGLSYFKEKRVKSEMKKLELPVLPSDHFGLLLTICPNVKGKE